MTRMTGDEVREALAEGRRDFVRANLRWASLYSADLRRASLSGACLYWADLSKADLSKADLRRASLSGACLYSADLSKADLSGASLRWANLSGADFRGARLIGTILDRTAPLPTLTDDEIVAAGLEPDSGGVRVWGWRTDRSPYVGDTHYVPRRAAYKAPVLSRDTGTECHPGIYLTSKRAAIRTADVHGLDIVRCYCRRDELVLIAKGGRCRRLWVPKEATNAETNC